MMGPKAGGSKEFDSTLSLIELIQDPDRYKKKLVELGESLKAYESQKTAAIDQIRDADKRLKVAQEAERKAIQAKSAYEATMSQKDAQHQADLDDFQLKQADLVERIRSLDEIENGLAFREQRSVENKASQDKMAIILDERETAVEKAELEVERKRKILAQL
jgi:hypothetical protein